ncbi:MAG: tRNA pseudouridine(54/55) synthase Pus10 [Candidatus Bathyarchaeota archaeon]|nr:tRNA pseudouridine(54/55) synthase Pus10 [Candidatus Bathyarchaeota archaeon]
MNILEKALKMLEKYPLCDHCLGRQFALLGHGMENDERGNAIKTVLTLEAHTLTLSKNKGGIKILKILATNSFSKTAEEILHGMKKRIPSKRLPKTCFLCEDKFKIVDGLAEKAIEKLKDYEFGNFLVGIELPVAVEEREDEFKAEFEVSYGENMRNEFGRVIGKKIAEYSGKTVEYKKPEIVVLVNPLEEKIRLQINPLYIAGRYRKLVRGIPQSKWFCTNCRGKGCEKCNWTGKMYPESVEEMIEKPFIDVTGGVKASFHASGREDIDARMLGGGRPFVIEITQPKKRFLDLKKLEGAVNAYAEGKVEISALRFADKDVVRKLKKAESAQKEYRLIIEFENKITAKHMHLLEEKLANTLIKQRTPIRVSHRRADLTREKYIYEVKLKKLSSKRAEMRVRCQGGLYVKELVTGDEGRTVPNVSEILKNKAKPIKLDVLNVIMKY